ncbi:MAG TPA: hypothetical protein V6D47_17015 [Oscillatoriaceae cyanobacterium]
MGSSTNRVGQFANPLPLRLDPPLDLAPIAPDVPGMASDGLQLSRAKSTKPAPAKVKYDAKTGNPTGVQQDLTNGLSLSVDATDVAPSKPKKPAHLKKGAHPKPVRPGPSRNVTAQVTQKVGDSLQLTGKVQQTDTVDGGVAATLTPAKQLQLTINSDHQNGRWKYGAKGKAFGTSVNVGYDAKKRLTTGLSQQLTNNVSVGVTHSQGKVAGTLQYKQQHMLLDNDALALKVQAGGANGVGAEYSVGNFAVGGGYDDQKGANVHFGMHVKF